MDLAGFMARHDGGSSADRDVGVLLKRGSLLDRYRLAGAEGKLYRFKCEAGISSRRLYSVLDRSPLAISRTINIATPHKTIRLGPNGQP